MKKISFLLIIFIILSTNCFAASGDNEGVDSIFYDAGIEKPLEWSSWDRQTKFSYLQNLGIYPLRGNSYKGNFDIQRYFQTLSVEKPTDWYYMSFEERKEFVEKAKSGEKIEDVILQKDVPKENYLKTKLQDIKNVFSKNFIEHKFFLAINLIVIFIILSSFFTIKSDIKKIGKIMSLYVLPFVLLAISIISLENEFFALLGILAEIVLIFLLFAKPLSVILKWKILSCVVTFRKELGLVSFWLFFFHAAGLIYIKNMTRISDYSEPFNFWALIAGIVMIILGITSNNWSIKKFKKNWKKIQYLSYPLLFLVLAHSGLFQNGNYNKLFIIGGLFLILKISEFKIKRKKHK